MDVADGTYGRGKGKGGKCKKKEAYHLMPEGVRGAHNGRHNVANELVSLVNQAGCGHVFMVAKELDGTQVIRLGGRVVCY